MAPLLFTGIVKPIVFVSAFTGSMWTQQQISRGIPEYVLRDTYLKSLGYTSGCSLFSATVSFQTVLLHGVSRYYKGCKKDDGVKVEVWSVFSGLDLTIGNTSRSNLAR